MSDRENDDEEGYATPPCSPVKLRVAPRSLARPGTKRAVRQIQNLKSRVAELQGCALDSTLSFHITEWSCEFGDEEARLSSEVEPSENVQVMLQRVSLVYGLLKSTFAHVSGVYIGKTSNQKTRFNHHNRHKKKPGHMLIMVAVGVFGKDDVPEQDRLRWSMNVDVLGLQYERMLTEAVVRDGEIPVFNDSEEAGGGGRASGTAANFVTVYVLLSVSNEC